MALIIDSLRVSNAFYLVVDSDPATGGGTKAGINSLAVDPNSVTYQKTGLLDTDWVVVAAPPAGGDFAERDLSNLTTTLINTSLLPDTDQAYDLGNDTFAWGSLSVGGIKQPGSNVYVVHIGNLALERANGDVALSWGGTDIDINTRKIINVVDPTDPQDVATKNYVDSVGGVTSLNSLTGAVVLAAGTNITLTPVGNTITVDASGGGPPIGDPNTLAYFDAAGNLNDNLDATFSDGNNSMAFGKQPGSTLSSSGIGSLATGYSHAGGTIASSAFGSISSGEAWAGNLSASAAGALAMGHAGGGTISGSGTGAHAHGFVEGGGGSIIASGDGSLSHGYTDSGSINASARGSLAAGSITSNGSISSSGYGSLACGEGTNGTIAAGNAGSLACGRAQQGGSVNSSGIGSAAMGFANSGRNITASSNGSHASGETATGSILATGLAAFAHGDAHTVSANLGTAFGLGQVVSSYQAFVVGQYALATGTAAAYVSTEVAFAVGNGAGVGTEANAFQVDKDGKNYTTAAHVDKLRVITGTDTLSARTDYKAIMVAAAGSYTLTLPPGEQGLNFIIGQASSNAGAFTIVADVPSGNLLDANIQSLFDGAGSSPPAGSPDLGAASDFAVLGSSTVTNTGSTVVSGDLGLSPGTSITGFPPGVVIGTIHNNDSVAAQAQTDALAAYTDLQGRTPDVDESGIDLGTLTLGPGVYEYTSSAQLTGTLTLDAGGDPNAVWIFQIGTTLTTAASSLVDIINGGSAANVYWQVGTSATLGASTNFKGTIIADQSITLTTGALVSGRVLALNAAVTLDSNTVTEIVEPVCCGSQMPIPITFDEPTNTWYAI